MGFWLRLRLGPFGYTLSRRSRRQSYRAYKAARQRRENYAKRYAAEKGQTASIGTKSAPTPHSVSGSITRFNGLTDPEFEGVSNDTLRAWHRFWSDEERSKDHPASATRSRAEQLRRLTREIEARASNKQTVSSASPASSSAPGRLKGITDQEFDGVSVPDLRAWYRYWSDEEKSKNDPALSSRSRGEHLRMITAEIEARGHRV